MTITEDEPKRSGLVQEILQWRNKRRNDQLITVTSLHERSISILQKRYGYTKEQAASELDKHYSKAWLG